MLRRTLVRAYLAEGGIGKVHPDVNWGYMQAGYLGPGWVAYVKQMPAEILTMAGGSTGANLNDRVGVVHDPEDPRHPVGVVQFGTLSHFDGSLLQLSTGKYGEILGGSRLLQILYDNYLEPFSCHRIGGQLNSLQKIPNKHHAHLEASVEYLGQTASIVGNVVVGLGSVVMEGVTIKGDSGHVYIAEGCQILENTCITSDAPSDLLAYKRDENINPYQQWDGMDGVCRVHQNTIIEPNCFLDSCSIGPFNRIGHNTKVMKGAITGTMVHILPGSVVLQDTKIGDGEIWGGAPAKKLGKVSKFEYKRPYFASLLHKENTLEAYAFMSRYGDQIVYHADAMGKLNNLSVQYDGELTPAIKEKMKDLVEGREPFHHLVTRITQGWSPANRPEDKNHSTAPPMPNIKNWSVHNTDSADSEWHGTYLNVKNIFHDFRW
ncbi:Hypothetical protein, putative [Bodo saltans]|uniref:Uncharacterized protein n=1 Tax=Bodo saltans TaxID=75058 RepID=A0A0S4JP99_BODSA|nr:Hypothetical protein, putative [Bodo saltans]|eukprot:CUG92060.1 Hypothetical protein, putative [Bodo saltans]